jgi:hypothetical protein
VSTKAGWRIRFFPWVDGGGNSLMPVNQEIAKIPQLFPTKKFGSSGRTLLELFSETRPAILAINCFIKPMVQVLSIS